MNGTYDLLHVLVGAVALAIFVVPTILAAWRRHPYFWIIVAVNFGGGILLGLVFGRMFAGLGWLAAVVLVLWPAERPDIDPILGNPTPTAPGVWTPGDAIRAAGYETKGGFTTGAAPMHDLSDSSAAHTTSVAPATKTCPDCAATVPAEAPLCRYCFHRFGSEPNNT